MLGLFDMNLREMALPAGWYPRNSQEISRFLEKFPQKPPAAAAPAAIAPHAGWFFSGKIAAVAVSSLDPDAETVLVLGGHLPRGYLPLFAPEDGVKTPLGTMMIDKELRELLQKGLPHREDSYRDNTVEVLLPMARFFFPEARLVWLRLPADEGSFEAGRIIAQAAASLGRKVVVLGSTDLTHYGAAYGFSPMGSGERALQWVRDQNDRAFIEAVEKGDPKEVLERAERDQSACSSGAVLGALGFAQERRAAQQGAGPARLLAYGTSIDALREAGEASAENADSFVGYAAMAMDKTEI
jgi:AmmeMemoRadiSam system protein B